MNRGAGAAKVLEPEQASRLYVVDIGWAGGQSWSCDDFVTKAALLLTSPGFIGVISVEQSLSIHLPPSLS
jgi:hypothetical protein